MVRLSGVIEPACMAFDGAADAATFEHDVDRALMPTLPPGDVVIMDNRSAPEGPEVERPVRAAGASPRPLTPRATP